MSFIAGLVSVTFRQLSPREIVALARDAGLAAMEWGGDVHVPPGDLPRAREVAQMTRDAGLSVLAYGSYFRMGEEDPHRLTDLIDTVTALGAPAVRVWAGRRGSADADASYRRRVVEQTQQLADVADRAGVVVCYEFHEGTLTDTDDSAVELLRAAAEGHPAVRTLWQPPHEQTVERCCQSLATLLPWLHHVHVFHWPRRGERAPLADGAARWRAYLDVLRRGGRACPLLLEFVRDDAPPQLATDAAALRSWIGSAAADGSPAAT
jgi:sugar phosphate isomerase/epimerase